MLHHVARGWQLLLVPFNSQAFNKTHRSVSNNERLTITLIWHVLYSLPSHSHPFYSRSVSCQGAPSLEVDLERGCGDNTQSRELHYNKGGGKGAEQKWHGRGHHLDLPCIAGLLLLKEWARIYILFYLVLLSDEGPSFSCISSVCMHAFPVRVRGEF
jgi:hypothetical protein